MIPAIGATITAIFVGVPTDWGKRPWIPLFVLAMAFVLFTAIYYIRIRTGKADVFVVLPAGSLDQSGGRLTLLEKAVVLTTSGSRPANIKYAYLLSLQATFFFISDSLRVSYWINRLNPRDETLVATGTSRVLSGAQSVFSLYALSLWIAATFGGK